MMQAPTKLVIPAAGYGTRLLPLSAFMPKELLPINKWPALFHTIKEALVAGLDEIVLIVSPQKAPWFKQAFGSKDTLIQTLKTSGKIKYIDELLEFNLQDRIRYVEQTQQSGLGHAVLCAHQVVGEHPFCVALPDEHLLTQPSELSTLLSLFSKYKKTCLSLMKVPKETVHQYGIVTVHKELTKDTIEVESCIEKPSQEIAPSFFAIIGRYLFTSDLWHILSQVKPGHNHEIQLTDAINQEAKTHHIMGHLFQGRRFDIGNHKGYLQCQSFYAQAL